MTDERRRKSLEADLRDVQDKLARLQAATTIIDPERHRETAAALRLEERVILEQLGRAP